MKVCNDNRNEKIAHPPLRAAIAIRTRFLGTASYFGCAIATLTTITAIFFTCPAKLIGNEADEWVNACFLSKNF